MILLANEGKTNQQIADALDTRIARVSKWRQRFGRARLAGLGDGEWSGKPAEYNQNTERQGSQRLQPLLKAPRNNHLVRGLGCHYGFGQDGSLHSTPAARVSRLHK